MDFEFGVLPGMGFIGRSSTGLLVRNSVGVFDQVHFRFMVFALSVGSLFMRASLFRAWPLGPNGLALLCLS